MRVAVDAREAYRSDPRGIGKSLIELYRCLAAQRPAWQFVMYHQLPGSSDPFRGFCNVEPRCVDLPAADRLNLWEHVRLPLAAWIAGANVLHCPANTGPRFSMLPMVLTIHDLIPIELDPHAPRTRHWVRRVKAAARAAVWVVTDSEYSKRQIVRWLGVAADRVVVNYLAVDGSAGHTGAPADRAVVAERYGIQVKVPYLLAFGAADPRKNTARLLQAWGRLSEALRQRAEFIVVGVQEAAQAQFREIAKNAGAGPECRLFGFVPEADLRTLLAGARALCYPSLAEGFGLPILEAYWCDAAVVTSDRASLPEVAGEAALIVDPLDVTALSHALARILTDDGLHAALIAKGRSRRGQFSWQRSAERLAQLLMCAAQENSGDIRSRLAESRHPAQPVPVVCASDMLPKAIAAQIPAADVAHASNKARNRA